MEINGADEYEYLSCGWWKRNYTVYKYYSSKEVLENIENLNIDLAILDVMMPEVDGFELCSKIRENYNFPIIFVTAKVEDIDKISGLTLGADDYITKPFQPLELIARVKAQLRRYTRYNGMKEENNKINFRNILIDSNTYEFYFNIKDGSNYLIINGDNYSGKVNIEIK